MRFKNKSGETVVLSNNTDSGQSKNCPDSFIKDKPEVVAEVGNSTEATKIVQHCKLPTKLQNALRTAKCQGLRSQVI